MYVSALAIQLTALKYQDNTAINISITALIGSRVVDVNAHLERLLTA